MGHHGVWGKGNGTFPFNMYETSVKVPLLISMPGTLLQGVKNEAILSAYDLFPTLLELCNIPSNACEKLPGTSFAKLLSGEKKTEKEEQEVVVFLQMHVKNCREQVLRNYYPEKKRQKKKNRK